MKHQRHIPKLNNMGFGHIGIVVGIAVLAIIGGSGAYIYLVNHKVKATAKNSDASTITNNGSGTTSTVNPYADWQTYTSTAEKATFKYPKNWSVSKPYMVSNDSSNTDQVGIESPSGAIKISYVTDIS